MLASLIPAFSLQLVSPQKWINLPRRVIRRMANQCNHIRVDTFINFDEFVRCAGPYNTNISLHKAQIKN